MLTSITVTFLLGGITVVALARIVGATDIATQATRVVFLGGTALFVLVPLADHARTALASQVVAVDSATVGPWVGVACACAPLLVLGHVLLGVWLLRRRARSERRTREEAEHAIARRRSRGTLPDPWEAP